VPSSQNFSCSVILLQDVEGTIFQEVCERYGGRKKSMSSNLKGDEAFREAAGVKGLFLLFLFPSIPLFRSHFTSPPSLPFATFAFARSPISFWLAPLLKKQVDQEFESQRVQIHVIRTWALTNIHPHPLSTPLLFFLHLNPPYHLKEFCHSPQLE